MMFMKFPIFLLLASAALAQAPYDLLLKGGHVIDARNHINEVRDVAIQNGRVAEVASNIDPAKAAKVVDVSGLYVAPGLVDIHVHVYAGTGMRGAYSGDLSVYPDGFTLRAGVTTAELADIVLREVDFFADSAPLADDRTLVVLKVR